MTYHKRMLKPLPIEQVVPQSVSGRYRSIKWRLLIICMFVYYAVPLIRWDRGPDQPNQAILFDLVDVRFHLFNLEVRPQELYYLTGGLVLATLVLVLVNALAGRVWCGFFCPQTVWTDLFMLVERKIEGDRRTRLRKLDARLTLDRVVASALKHAVWMLIAAGTGGAFVLYFADAPTLLADVFNGQASSAAYGMILALTFTTYGLAGFGREKVCTWMCPWPRLQGAIWDPEALTVTYRDYRGEPRMSVKKAAAAQAADLEAGECVDCKACVAVCPIGIDIRQGPNIACINCGLCADACDTTMIKLGRDQGLIDYESWVNIERGHLGEPRAPARIVRLKTIALTCAILALSGGMALSIANRDELTLSITHERDPIAIVLSDGRIRNAYELRITHARATEVTVDLRVAGRAAASLALAAQAGSEGNAVRIDVGPNETRKVRVTVFGERALAGDLAFTVRSLTTNYATSAVERFNLP